MLAVAATCLVAALVAAPTAGAAAKQDSAKAQSAQSKKKLARDIRSVRRRTNAARRSIRTLGQTIAAIQNTVNGVKSAGEGTQGQVNGILAAVPQVLDGLTQLRDASLALRNGLETLAAKTTEGFNTVATNLTRLGEFSTSQEYGLLAIYTFAPGSDVNEADPCCRIIPIPTADIPDNGTPASASGEFPIAVAPNNLAPPNRVAPGTEVALGAVIKSNEADGGATGDPAGQVGALLQVFCAGNGPTPGTCGDGNPDPQSQPEFESGQLMCVVGPTNSNTFPVPGGTIDQSLVNIQEKSSFTDPTLPPVDPFNGTSLVNPLEDAQQATGTGSATEGSCVLPSFGAYRVVAQSQFVDIPTSATPGPKD